jgi:transposase
MRGTDSFTEGLFSMHRLDDFVPANHPLRRIRVMVNEALVKMDGLFSAMYEVDVKGGRPSVAPEKLTAWSSTRWPPALTATPSERPPS